MAKEKLADYNFAAPQKKAAKHRLLACFEQVALNVPLRLKKTTPFVPFIDHRQNIIHSYFHYGWALKGGVGKIVLNEKFFNLPVRYLGQKIVADVEVEEKTTARGDKFIQLIIYKLPDNTPTARLMKITEQPTTDNCLAIHQSNMFLEFPKI